MIRPGPRNLITDVPGILVGQAQDDQIKTGTTVVTADRPFTAAVHVMGGAPGTRETELLDPEKTVEHVDAIFLSGGSAFGLDAAQGVSDGLRAQSRGFAVGDVTIPIVPGAIVFDLANGGDKSWTTSPYPALGRAAFEAAGPQFDLGTAGAGTGAMIADLKGGVGSASATWQGGTIGALVIANPIGQVTQGDGPHFHAAPYEIDGEFGGSGVGTGFDPAALPPTKATSSEREATAIAIVATDFTLTKSQAKRVATMAHDGMARAIWPSHSPFDGDVVFAASTGRQPLPVPDVPPVAIMWIGHVASLCLSRAIARAIYHASPAPGDVKPTYRQKFG